MNRVTLFGLSAALMLGSANATAATVDKRWYVSPSVTYTFADQDRQLRTSNGGGIPVGGRAQNGVGFELAFGRAVSDSLNLELNLFGSELDISNLTPAQVQGLGINSSRTEWQRYGIGADALWFFSRDRDFAPYFNLGVGVMRTEVLTLRSTNPFVEAGFGFTTQLCNCGLQLKGELKYQHDFFQRNDADDDDFGDVVATLGLVLPFGKQSDPVSRAIAASNNKFDNRWYVSALLSYIQPDSDRPLEDNSGYGASLILGRAVSESWNAEISVFGDTLQTTINDDYDQIGAGLDMLYFGSGKRSTTFAPYALFGLGAIRTELNNATASNPYFNVGLGFMTQVSKHGTAIRGEVRYRLDATDDNNGGTAEFGDWMVNVGVAIPLGSRRVAKVEPPITKPPVIIQPPTKALDSDGDGVPNSRDRCPNTRVGVVVNLRGCELDGDGDGVVDSNDICPATPAGIKVGGKGCELDADRDGIVNSADKCPNTKAGVRVDENGCDVPEIVVVHFKTGSHQLSTASKAKLNEVAKTMLRRKYIVAIAGGYTDSVGTEQYNLKLSLRRAKAVKQYLIEKGVRTDNITARGYGEANPTASNATASGRKQNRRVELRVINP